jgi:MtN3 and saliva related transmembrane protein
VIRLAYPAAIRCGTPTRGTRRARCQPMLLVIGLVAAGLTIAGYLAQSYKILKTRDVKSLSLSMWLLAVFSFSLWVVYGVLLGQWPIIIPNAVCGAIALFILVLKLLPRSKREQVARKLVPSES